MVNHFTADIFGCIFMNGKFYILIEISLKFIPKGPLGNIGLDNGLVPNMWQAISEPRLTCFTYAHMQH